MCISCTSLIYFFLNQSRDLMVDLKKRYKKIIPLLALNLISCTDLGDSYHPFGTSF
jgi:hypothetical protein